MKTEFKELLDKCGMTATTLYEKLKEGDPLEFELLTLHMVRKWCGGHTIPWPSAVRKIRAQSKSTGKNFGRKK